MSTLAIIVYEILYFIFFYGFLFSLSTTISFYFPHASLPVRLALMLILFTGFFVPYFLKLLRIRLTVKHYLGLLSLVFLSYIMGAHFYYGKTMLNKHFFSILNPLPTTQNVAVPKPHDVYRIICLGGSTTEGAKGSNKYPVKLQKMLNENYPDKKIEVINAGKYFYTTEHLIIQYLFTLKELEPDLILVCEAINDVFPSFTMPPFASKPYRSDYAHFYGFLGTLRYARSFEEFLKSFFFADLRRPKPQPVYFNDFKSQHAFRRNLETIIEITTCKGIALILASQAHCYSRNNDSDEAVLCFNDQFLINETQYPDERSYYDAMELFNGIVRETAEKYSVPFSDQSPAFEGKRKLFTDSVHLTEEGNELKAKLFFDKILDLKLIEHKYIEKEGEPLR